MNEIRNFRHLTQLIKVLQAVKQLSWAIDQTGKRYPYPEAMTEKEISALIKAYQDLGMDLNKLSDDYLSIEDKFKSVIDK